MIAMQPRRPVNMPQHAIDCLEALKRAGLGDLMSIGGALGLMHYCEYRTTHDLDAWWEPDVTEEQRRLVLSVIEETLKRKGEVRCREWGDVTSAELRVRGKAIFGIQIAKRSARLEEPLRDPETAILLDSPADLVASKMVALVERGAPRDFRDIHHVCIAGLFTPSRCWELWGLRQSRSGGDTNVSRARLAITMHLQRIQMVRPLDAITDLEQRTSADLTRRWFREVFLNEIG